MNLILIRHTPAAVEQGICYGRTDVPLHATFTSDREVVRAQLPAPPWRVVSSPLTRCRQLAESLGSPVRIDERLVELNFGRWELRRWEDIPREELDKWGADFVSRPPPGGESFLELAVRAEHFVSDCAKLYFGETVLVVTHAGVIRALLAPRLGLTLKQAFSIPVDFGGLYPLVKKQGAAFA
jgi:alpha-ribazole phosphatase